MKKITRSFGLAKKIKYLELFLQYAKTDDMYLTIETTGLSPERHRIVSISVATLTDENIEITTFFSDNKDDELTIIESGISELEKAGRIITWNGDSFDFRFLSKRSAGYGIKLQSLPSHDLRKILSPMKRLHSDSLSLYELLEEMGLDDPEIPDGQTLVTLYQTYIGTGEDRYSVPIERHSIYKITGIMNLMVIKNCLRINKAAPEIEEISTTYDTVKVKGTTDIFFPVGLNIRLTGIDISFSGASFNGTFAVDNGRIRMYFPDPSSYVKLKSDGSMIPKELSKSMSKNEYESVTKENCFSLVKLPEEESRKKKQLENYIRSLEKM